MNTALRGWPRRNEKTKDYKEEIHMFLAKQGGAFAPKI